jgi:hypothetical protein
MANFDTEIEPDEFWDSCTKWERKKLINLIVKEASEKKDTKENLLNAIDTHFQDTKKDILQNIKGDYSSIMLEEFHSSLEKLGQAYFRLSNEDIDRINELAKRF